MGGRRFTIDISVNNAVDKAIKMHDTAIEITHLPLYRQNISNVGKLNENELANRGKVYSSLIYIAGHISHRAVREVMANCITKDTSTQYCFLLQRRATKT
jgi:hypothetical protein